MIFARADASGASASHGFDRDGSMPQVAAQEQAVFPTDVSDGKRKNRTACARAAGATIRARAGPRRQPFGNVNSSKRTFVSPASRNFAAAHSTARSYAGDPTSRAPMSSVRCRRSSVDCP